ncbi:MAG: hypothetical protein ACJ8NR_12790 [Sulfurifustis sp.]
MVLEHVALFWVSLIHFDDARTLQLSAAAHRFARRIVFAFLSNAEKTFFDALAANRFRLRRTTSPFALLFFSTDDDYDAIDALIDTKPGQRIDFQEQYSGAVRVMERLSPCPTTSSSRISSMF